MPRRKMIDPSQLSVAELRHLLVVREKLEKLDARKSELTRDLAAVEAEIAKVLAKPVGAKKKPGRKPGRPKSAKKTTKKTTKKKTAKKAAKKVVKKTAKKAAKKKVVRKAAPKKTGRKVAARAKPTVETVVAELIRKQGKAMSFQDIHQAIIAGKLVRTKSKNFANVLRRTLSTSKALKRVGRGVYDVA